MINVPQHFHYDKWHVVIQKAIYTWDEFGEQDFGITS